MGGQGVISVLSNIAPQRVAEVQTLCLAGDYVAARQKQDALVEAIQVLFSESSPIPVKAALTLMNKMRGEIRLPLTPATEVTIDRLRSVMHNLGIL
jgi:4-hydroxy-tetrahydrodipicolinate synthase